MIPVSSEFRTKMQTNTEFRECADITLSDGRVLELKEKDFTLKNNSLNEGAGVSGLPLGVAVCRSIQIELMNDDDHLSDYDFYGAKIHLYLTYQLSHSVEKIDYGFYTVTIPETYGATVIITAFDDMYKADVPYDSDLVYPATLGAILGDACQKCHINQGDVTFLNSTFLASGKPTDVTYRQVIGYVAMIAGGNARIDMEGYLRIKTYTFNAGDTTAHLDGGNFDYNLGDVADGGNFLDYSSGDSYDGGRFGDNKYVVLNKWKNLKIETDDVLITGVRDKKTQYLYGHEGYILEVDNPLLSGVTQQGIGLIGNAMIGGRMRPFSGDCVANPIVEFMDDVILHDRKGNTFISVVTDVNFVFLGLSSFKNSATSARRKASEYFSNATEAFIKSRNLIDQEKNEREEAVARLAQAIVTSSGLYMTTEIQPDESVIYYMHNKPTLAQSTIIWRLSANAFAISTDGGETYPYGLDVSGTAILNKIYAEGINADYITGGVLKVGGFNNLNGQVLVYNNQDQLCGSINNNGLVMYSPTTRSEVIMHPDLGFLQKTDVNNMFAGVTNVQYPEFPRSDWSINPYKTERLYRYRAIGGGHLKCTVIAKETKTENGILYARYKFSYQWQEAMTWEINSSTYHDGNYYSEAVVTLPEDFRGKTIFANVEILGFDTEKMLEDENFRYRNVYYQIQYNQAIYKRDDGTTWQDTAFGAWDSAQTSWSVGYWTYYATTVPIGNMGNTALNYQGTEIVPKPRNKEGTTDGTTYTHIPANEIGDVKESNTIMTYTVDELNGTITVRLSVNSTTRVHANEIARVKVTATY